MSNKIMQIKSWQIALIGTIIQFFWLIRFIFLMNSLIKEPGYHDVALGTTMVIIFGVIYLLTGFISILLLYFIKTQKIGAKINIIIGVANLTFFLNDSGLNAIISSGIQSIFLVFAGVYYFWKKA